MQENLVIVESPAKAKTIEKFLGKDYIVKSSFGHIRDLSKKDLGINIGEGFKPVYEIPADKKKVVDELTKLAKDKTVWLASDEDREGEAIAWHLTEVLGLPVDKTKRIVFHEITKRAILEAIEQPRTVNMDLVNAQQARRILDRLVGFELSPVLWKKVRPSLSAGRVQSVAVRLIVEREREIIAFRSTPYFRVVAQFHAAGDPDKTIFKAELSSRFETREQAEEFLNTCIGATFTVAKAEEKPAQRFPAPPFTTSTLQQTAGNRLGMGARAVMRAAQSLYENGYITYMRTDSVTLSQEGITAARNAVSYHFGDKFLSAEPKQYATKTAGAQEAHECIRPAGSRFHDPDELASKLPGDQLRLYTLIWQRTLACQMADATGSTATVRLSAPAGPTEGEAVFQASGTVIEFPGFMKATGEGRKPKAAAPGAGAGSDQAAAAGKTDAKAVRGDASESNTSLPPMSVGQQVEASDIEPDGHETQQPARYTEATLVKTLEAKEIGRPSTYASIISTIMDRGYVYERGRALIPSWLAFSVTKLLETNFPKLVDYQFTAEMENGLDRIAHGEESGRDWLTHFYFGSGEGAARNADEAHEGLQQQVAQLGEIDARAINTIDIGDGLHVRVGRYGPYLEDMEHLDAEGNPKRASLPDTIAPDELTVAVARDLIDNHSGGPRELGVDPVSGGTVEVRNGRFGPYVALAPPAEASAGAAGDTAGASAAKKGPKKAAAAAASRPKMASLFKTMSPESLSLEDALKLLSLPREVGTYEETNAETGEVSECTVAANNGRYGPYLTKTGADGKSETRSLASEDEIFTVDIDKAKELFSQPKYGRGRGRGAAKPPLRDLGKDPNTGKNVTIKDGRFGAYITDGETNRTVPRQYTPESITPDDAFRLLAEKRAAGPSTRGRRGAGRAGGAKAVAGKGKKGGTSAAVSAQEAKRAERRAEVKKLANKGWSNQRIAEKLGSTPATVKKDVDWLTANEDYERPAVIPKRG